MLLYKIIRTSVLHLAEVARNDVVARLGRGGETFRSKWEIRRRRISGQNSLRRSGVCGSGVCVVVKTSDAQAHTVFKDRRRTVGVYFATRSRHTNHTARTKKNKLKATFSQRRMPPSKCLRVPASAPQTIYTHALCLCVCAFFVRVLCAESGSVFNQSLSVDVITARGRNISIIWCYYIVGTRLPCVWVFCVFLVYKYTEMRLGKLQQRFAQS